MANNRQRLEDQVADMARAQRGEGVEDKSVKPIPLMVSRGFAGALSQLDDAWSGPVRVRWVNGELVCRGLTRVIGVYAGVVREVWVDDEA